METWRDFELASTQRYWDGVATYTSRAGGSTGAVYLLGYVAEMTLKAAFFRARRFPPTQVVTGQLRQLWAAATTSFPNRFPRPDYHDLEMLCEALIYERQQIGRPFSPTEALGLRRNTATMCANWRVTLRYESAVLPDHAATMAFDAADWFLTEYARLY